jgi:UDP-GlcNAc:undecaprenyl-phosphate/decaprenyl-phosphate GlcNAc-1-phosphate transferase
MIIHFSIYIITYALIIMCYIFLSKKYNNFDIPSDRSSHIINTVTGGGFIFPISFFLGLLFTGDFVFYRSILSGLILISVVSFSDDLKSIHPLIRVIVQVIAVSLLLWQTGGLFKMKPWQVVPGFILVVGIVNSFNFMDGINGMNVLYSASVLILLWCLRASGILILPDNAVFLSLFSSIISFAFFNVRKKALCFSGDVGSISMAYIISLLIIQVMIATDSGQWILLVGIYGLDSVGTIVLRVIRKERLWMPHRTHFYQFLVNEKKYPHVLVSLIYAISQFILSIILWKGGLLLALLFYILLILIYVCARLSMEGKERLFTNYFTQTTE